MKLRATRTISKCRLGKTDWLPLKVRRKKRGYGVLLKSGMIGMDFNKRSSATASFAAALK